MVESNRGKIKLTDLELGVVSSIRVKVERETANLNGQKIIYTDWISQLILEELGRWTGGRHDDLKLQEILDQAIPGRIPLFLDGTPTVEGEVPYAFQINMPTG